MLRSYVHLFVCLVLLAPALVSAEVQVDRDPISGRVVALRSTTPPKTISFGSRSISLVASYNAEAVAMAHLVEHKDLFGLFDPASQLELVSARSNEAGFNHVRYRQVHQGVPVLGEAIVHLYPDGSLQMIRSSLALELPASVIPTILADEATVLAIEAVARVDDRGLELEAAKPELMIVPMDVVERKSEPDSRLSWRVRVYDEGSEGMLLDEIRGGPHSLDSSAAD